MIHQSLVQLDKATRMLAEIHSVDDARSIVDLAEAARVYARQVGLGLEAQNHAAEVKLRAQRRGGEILGQMEKQNGGRPKKNQLQAATSLPPTLEELGIEKTAASRWQNIAKMPEAKFEQFISETKEAGGEITTSGALKVASGQVLGVHFSSATDEWSTPQDLFDQLNAEFEFTLDVCASVRNAKCERFFDIKDNGLSQNWVGSCWMNPPYGDAIVDWITKAHESASGKTVVVCLVPARTDTGWWWDHVRYGEVRFLRGRLKFGGCETSAPFPSAVVIFGRKACVKWWER